MSDADTLTLVISDADSPADAPAVSVPRALGPVRLTRELGRGGMGVVWLGRHELLARDVAVKFLLRAAPGPDDPSYAALLNEARLAAALRHPGLVAIHHADLINHIPYFIMDFIDGPSLADLLDRSGPLPWPTALELLDAVCDALGQLHDRELVHRDIKPANILLDAAGHPFVTDFGLARARTLPGQPVAKAAGTPVFMAPESFDGAFSPRSDVYSLAFTMFQVLTGRTPFLGSLAEIMQQHCDAPFPTDPLRAMDIDPAVIEVLERAAHKNPLYRYKTARHFLHAIHAAQPADSGRSHSFARLQSLVADYSRDLTPSVDQPAEKRKPSSYYDEVARLAEARRRAPETPAPSSAPPEHERQPAAQGTGQFVLADLPCIQCGYNLRTLGASAACPECKSLVSDSLNPRLLRFSHPGWISTISRGLLFIAVANLVAIPALFISAITNGPGSMTLAIVATFIVMSMACISIGGVLLFLTPESRPASGGLRRWLRVLAVLAIVPSLVFLPAMLLNLADVLAIAVRIEFILVLVLFSGLLLYLSRLASRVPSIPHARQARTRAAALLLPLAIQLLGLTIDATWMDHYFSLGPSGGMLGLPLVASAAVLADACQIASISQLISAYPSAREISMLVVLIATLSFVVLFLLTMLLLFRFRKSLRQVLTEASSLKSDQLLGPPHQVPPIPAPSPPAHP